MGPDRHETTLHCDSMEQKPDCQISLSAAISDNISTVKPGVCVSKIPVSAPRLSMRRHRPHPRHHGGLCPGGAAASTRLCGKQAEPLGASRHWHQTSTHCWEVSSHLHFHGTRAVLTPRCLPEECAIHLQLPGTQIQKNHTKTIFNTVN